MSQESFWRSRLVSEALGILLLLSGLLATLSLASYSPRDANLFSVTTGEAASPANWIGRFGADLSSALYAILGLAAWAVPALLLLWGWRRFWQRPFPNPGTKAAGFVLLFLSIPALLSLTLGRRTLFGEESEAGGIVGRAVAEAPLLQCLRQNHKLVPEASAGDPLVLAPGLVGAGLRRLGPSVYRLAFGLVRWILHSWSRPWHDCGSGFSAAGSR